MIDRHSRLRKLVEYRRTAEERCQMRVSDLRGMVRARKCRLEELEAALFASTGTFDRTEHAGRLAAAERYAEILRARASASRDKLRGEQERLRSALRELAAAGRRRLAVERLMGDRMLDVERRALADAQDDIDDHGRLRMMLEEE